MNESEKKALRWLTKKLKKEKYVWYESIFNKGYPDFWYLDNKKDRINFVEVKSIINGVRQKFSEEQETLRNVFIGIGYRYQLIIVDMDKNKTWMEFDSDINDWGDIYCLECDSLLKDYLLDNGTCKKCGYQVKPKKKKRKIKKYR